ncbi:nucleoside recognition protein [Desulfurobacterium sp.]
MNFDLKETLKVAVRSSLFIVKLIVPLYIVADTLLYFGILNHVAFVFKPLTELIHLPVESAVGIAAGMIFNLYAAIAFLAPLSLTPFQWTVVGLFLGIAHSFLVESAIMKKLGIPVIYSIILRTLTAIVAVKLLMLLPFNLSSRISSKKEVSVKIYKNVFDMLGHSVQHAVILSGKIVLLIVVIIFALNFIKNLPPVKRYSEKVNTMFSILTGLFLGITYGAGVLINEAESGSLTKRDILFIGTFLMICHSVIEDSFLFVIFGASWIPMVAIRVMLAVAISPAVAKARSKILT